MGPDFSPDFSIETRCIAKGLTVCGVDEAGRGPWAGPVVAAAVVLDPYSIPPGINDSKKLTEMKRAFLYQPIMDSARVGIGIVDVEMIDRINILQATFFAMQLAVSDLANSRFAELPDLALVDGNRAPPLSIRVQTIIGGDAKSLSIAAASIIAKVTRDRIMTALDELYPHYGFAKHKGYGTAAHAAALQRHGPSLAHRRSFKPIAKLTMSGQFDSRGVRHDS